MQLVFDRRYRRLVDFLSLDTVELEEPHVPEKIMYLYDYAERKAKSTDLETVISKLKSLKKQTGDTLRGMPLLKDMYKVARLDGDKLLAEDQKKIQSETDEERKAREDKLLKLSEERSKHWADTKEQIKREAEAKELENIAKADYVGRMIKSEDKQQSKTSVNYKIAKDEAPAPVRVKPYDTGE